MAAKRTRKTSPPDIIEPPIAEENLPLPPEAADPIEQTDPAPFAPPVPAPRKRKRRRGPVAIALYILGLIVLFLICANAFHWWNWGLNAQEIQNREGAAALKQLNSMMLLPDEAPSIAIVTNAASLKASQPFYANALNGDVLFVFPKTAEAILYRPGGHKIINVATITINDSTTSSGTKK